MLVNTSSYLAISIDRGSSGPSLIDCLLTREKRERGILQSYSKAQRLYVRQDA